MINNPRWNILGFTQPFRLIELAWQELHDNKNEGFLCRFTLLLSEPKQDGIMCAPDVPLPSLALIKLVMVELGRNIDQATLSPEAQELFDEFALKTNQLIQDYCLTLEYVCGVLGKTNGKVARYSAGIALIDFAFMLCSETFPDMYEVSVIDI